MGRLSKDKRDIYYREAKREGFRARSAFKLLQIDDEVGLLKGVRNVADLCAAPGGWSQVLARRLLLPEAGGDNDGDEAQEERRQEQDGGASASDIGRQEGRRRHPAPRIVAVDQYLMEPIDGVIQVQGDITHAATVKEVLSHFHGELADLVICDGAPDATGRADFDEYVQHQLLLSAQHLASALLRRGGTFVAKIFRGEHTGEVFAMLSRSFGEVLCCKPRASRNSSQEAFVVCRGFCPPDGFDPADALYAVDRHEELSYLGPGSPSLNVPFIACGSGEGALDADTNYPVSLDHELLDPVAPPVNAPYKEAIDERRGQKRPAAVAAAAAPSALPSGDGPAA